MFVVIIDGDVDVSDVEVETVMGVFEMKKNDCLSFSSSLKLRKKRERKEGIIKQTRF